MSNESRPKSTGDELAAKEVNQDLPIEMTAGEAISSTPLAVYIKDADGYVYKTDADFDDERIHNFVGFSMDISTASGSPVSVQTKGIVGGFSGLDAGKEYYLSGTVGVISTTAGTYEKFVGIALSATELLIIQKQYRGLTQKAQTITGIKTFASFPVTPSSAPSTDYQVTNKKYTDDERKDIVGAPVSKTENIEYEAVTAGVLLVRAEIGSNGNVAVKLDSGSPVTIVAQCYLHSTYNLYGSLTVPIPKGYHYKVVPSTAGLIPLIYFFPLS